MRRFLSRVAVYFGLKDDDSGAPPPERITACTVFAIFASALIVSVIADGVKALIEGRDSI